MSGSSQRDPLFTGPFYRLWAFNFITFITVFQLFPTIPLRIIDLGGSTAAGGRFLAIYTWACALSAPITGTIADHLGRKRALVIAAVSFLVFSALYGVTTWFPLLLLFACIHGVFWSALMSSSAAITSEIIPESRRTEGIAWWGMASTAAVAVAPLVGLKLYERGWIWVAGLMVALSVVMFLLALRVHGGAERSTGPFPAMQHLVDWRVTVVALALFVMSYAYGGITSYVAIYSKEQGVEPASLFFTLFAVAILGIRILTARLGDRHGPKALLYPSWVLVPIGLALLPLAASMDGDESVLSPAAMIAISALVFGAGFGAAYPAFATWVLGRTDSSRRGATFGSILLAFDIGIGSGSLLTGMIAERWGFPAAFSVAAGISALSLPLFLVTARLLEKHE